MVLVNKAANAQHIKSTWVYDRKATPYDLRLFILLIQSIHAFYTCKTWQRRTYPQLLCKEMNRMYGAAGVGHHNAYEIVIYIYQLLAPPISPSISKICCATGKSYVLYSSRMHYISTFVIWIPKAKYNWIWLTRANTITYFRAFHVLAGVFL